jgi:hypothetical protein
MGFSDPWTPAIHGRGLPSALPHSALNRRRVTTSELLLIFKAWWHGAVQTMAVLQRALTLPGGLDPSIVENTQVLQFAVHVKQRVPFAEQVASVESLCSASLLKHVNTI